MAAVTNHKSREDKGNADLDSDDSLSALYLGTLHGLDAPRIIVCEE
jgi:hypothetical protein